MEQVIVYTVGEQVRAFRGEKAIEFFEYNSNQDAFKVCYTLPEGDPIVVEKTTAPIHCIREHGKPDVFIAIEPKLYDLFTNIKIRELTDNLWYERNKIENLRNSLDNTRSCLGEMNKIVHEFNNLPWWKRAYFAITKGV